MKIKYYNNSSILIEYKNTKILFDPWLVGQSNYGSWGIFPELKINWDDFKDLDYIHISHIHTDHLHEETLKKLPNHIPILIHNWDDKFVKRILESWGKKVIEIEHGEKFNLGDDLDFHLYAADGCDPEACFKFFGCGKMSNPSKSVGIDTFSLLKSDKKTFVQINDCPYPLMKNTLNKLKDKFKTIDLLFVSYTGAGSYPQCWSHYTDDEKLNKYGLVKKQKFLDWGMGILDILKPKHYMPYAGQYFLSGFLSKLDKFKVTPTIPEALKFYKENYKEGISFCLNQNEYFDLETEKSSSPYIHPNEDEKEKYIDNVLSQIKFPYEYDDEVNLEQLLELIPNAFKRYSNKRKELNFSTNTNIYLHLMDGKMIKIPCNGDNFTVINKDEFNDTRYVTYKIHPKLLLRILKGPRYAHMNNAEGGSHIEFTRKPEIYERKLYYSMNFFHS